MDTNWEKLAKERGEGEANARASLHDWERTAADLIEVEAATRAKLHEWQAVAARLAEELDDYQLRLNPSVREALAKYEILKGTAL